MEIKFIHILKMWAREELEGDKWDNKTNSIVYAADEYIEEEDKEDISLEEAQSYIQEQQRKIEVVKILP